MITPDSPYPAQVRLLVRVLPVIARASCFALKGGTAINLFVRDMPRLSVDIDLAFVPLLDRAAALQKIDESLGAIVQALTEPPYSYRTHGVKRQDGHAVGCLVSDAAATIRIEVSPVLRGTVFPHATRPITASAEAEYGFAEVPVLSFADLYAGKIVAALDRQHPRDLFDVMLLLAEEGVDEELFRAFIIYLISHDGSIARLINPALKPIGELFERQFVGMTTSPVSLAALERARSDLIATLHARLTERERSFLVSFKRGEPQWDLIAVEHASALPAVRWKLHNLALMPPDKRREAADNLKRVLDAI